MNNAKIQNSPLDEKVENLLNGSLWEEGLNLWLDACDSKQLRRWIAEQISDDSLANNHAQVRLLNLIREWYMTPNDALRWSLFSLADDIGFDTPLTLLALSIFWSEGSMSPQGFEPVYPEGNLAHKMCRCALLALACERHEKPQPGLLELFTHWKAQETTHV